MNKSKWKVIFWSIVSLPAVRFSPMFIDRKYNFIVLWVVIFVCASFASVYERWTNGVRVVIGFMAGTDTFRLMRGATLEKVLASNIVLVFPMLLVGIAGGIFGSWISELLKKNTSKN